MIKVVGKCHMKKMHKIIILMVVILIIISITAIIIINIKKEKTLIEENIEVITNNYEEFKTQIQNYNQIRNEYNEKAKNIFYDTYKEQKKEIDDILIRYNETIQKIDKTVDNINKKCIVLYDDANINSICSIYQELYEKIINLYVTDLTSYNNIIREYNEYKSENLELFQMIHSEYIDYNNDTKYEGSDTFEEN